MSPKPPEKNVCWMSLMLAVRFGAVLRVSRERKVRDGGLSPPTGDPGRFVSTGERVFERSKECSLKVVSGYKLGERVET
jgi:hypothetical protein